MLPTAMLIATLSWWRGQRFFNGPTMIKTIGNCFVSKPKLLGPSAQALSCTVMRNQASLACVLRLLQSRGPLAIIRAVWSVVIDALDGGSWKRPWSHVLQKSEKRFPPAITNSDPATAVMPVVFVVYAATATFHGFPNTLCERMRQTVLSCSKATARFYVFFAKINTSNLCHLATFATASPECAMIAAHPGKLNYRQFSVDVARFVFYMAGQLSRIACSHLKFLCNFVVVRAVWKRPTSGRLVYFNPR